MENKTEIAVDTLHIFFKYETLDINTLIDLLQLLTRLQVTILNTTSPVYFNQHTNQKFRNTLLLTEINTGNSIDIKLTEKWKFELPFGLGSIEGPCPSKLGIPLIIAAFLLFAAEESMKICNEYHQRQINILQEELLKNEIHQKMCENETYEHNIRKTSKQAKNVVNYIMYNQDIFYFEVNGIPIKDKLKH